MYNLEDVWNPHVPVFLLSSELYLKSKIPLNDILNRVLLDLDMHKETVDISYDKCFISFITYPLAKFKEHKALTIYNQYKILTNLVEMWNSLAQQVNYEHNFTLDIYGIYKSSAVISDHKNYLVCMGRRIERVEKLDDINSVSYQKAIQASKLALPL